MANAAKRQFAKDYPEIDVKIDGRQGWIVVNGKKAVNISSADGQPIQIEDMVDQMKQAYLGHETIQDKYKNDPAFLAYLTDEDYAEGDESVTSLPDGDEDGIADFADTDKDNDGKVDVSNGRRDIVHARNAEVYEEAISRNNLDAWLAKNLEFTLVEPGTAYSGWWGTDVIDEESWYVDGPEEGPKETFTISESMLPEHMPDSWSRILGACLDK